MSSKKPWPSDKIKQYRLIKLYLLEINKALLQIKRETFGTSLNEYYIPQLLPVVKTASRFIQEQCGIYTENTTYGTPRWAKNAVINIDFLAAELIKFCKEAEDEYESSAPNWHLIEVYIAKSIERAGEMSVLINSGPPPEPSKSDNPINEWIEGIEGLDEA